MRQFIKVEILSTD